MARINIEDSLFTDNRFLELCIKLGNPDTALGVVVRAWIVAQKFWKNDRSLIPKEKWKEQRLNIALLEVGLVEEKEHGFYVCGSENQFDWLISRKINAKLGGKASGETRRSNINNLERSKHQAKRSKAKLDEPSSSFSLSFSKEELNTYVQNAEQHEDPDSKPFGQTNVRPTVGLKFDFEKIYQGYPRKQGKIIGLNRLTKFIKTEKDYLDFEKAVSNYRKYCEDNKIEEQYQKLFSSFVGKKEEQCWRDWVDYEKTSTSNKNVFYI